MRRIRVYIAGPIRKGDLADNVNQATQAFIELAKAGFAPICPHWSVYASAAMRRTRNLADGSTTEEVYAVATPNGNPSMKHEDWLAVDLAWVESADAVLRLPGDSVGAGIECQHAQRHGIPVFHSVKSLIEDCRATMDSIATVGLSAKQISEAVEQFLELIAKPSRN